MYRMVTPSWRKLVTRWRSNKVVTPSWRTLVTRWRSNKVVIPSWRIVSVTRRLSSFLYCDCSCNTVDCRNKYYLLCWDISISHTFVITMSCKAFDSLYLFCFIYYQCSKLNECVWSCCGVEDVFILLWYIGWSEKEKKFPKFCLYSLWWMVFHEN